MLKITLSYTVSAAEVDPFQTSAKGSGELTYYFPT